MNFSKSGFVLSILALSFLAFTQGCGKNDEDSKNGGNGSQQAGLSNPYFDTFVAEHALPADQYPPVDDNVLSRGEYALTQYDALVYVEALYGDGRAEVRSEDGYERGSGLRVETNLTARQNGAYGLFEGHYAITKYDQVVRVEKVFADGRVQVVDADDRGNRRVESNLVPRRNGTMGLTEGTLALTRVNERVQILIVFADGRAQIASAENVRYGRRIENGSTLTVAR